MDLAVLVCPVLVVVEAPFSVFSCGSFLSGYCFSVLPGGGLVPQSRLQGVL